MTLRSIDWARWYQLEESTLRSLERAYPPARILDILTETLGQGVRTRILELGCAPGRWLAWAQTRLRVSGVGLELDAEGIRLTRALYPSIPLVRGDAFALPFADRSFDAVYALGLLEHFENPSGILREARRVLAQDGVSLWSVPNILPGSLCRWHWKRLCPDLFEAHKAYSPDELAALVEATGFAVCSAEYNGIYIPHMQRVMSYLPLRWLFKLAETRSLAASVVVVAKPVENARALAL